MSPSTLPTLLVCATLLSGIAHAHDLWLEPSGQRLTLYQGHRHSAHKGSDTLDYGKTFVTSATCLDASGGKRPLVIASHAPWTASGDCAALLLDMSSGYWSKTPWETKNVPKNETPGAIKSWRSLDSLKRLERWAPAFTQPLGEGLEIVPTTDPFALKPDDKLVVRVLLAGKPVAGAPVAYHGDTRGETDAEGRIAIRLRHSGIQLISASTELPLKDGKADVEIRAAVLQFETKK
jgi:nickel transport protein